MKRKTGILIKDGKHEKIEDGDRFYASIVPGEEYGTLISDTDYDRLSSPPNIKELVCKSSADGYGHNVYYHGSYTQCKAMIQKIRYNSYITNETMRFINEFKNTTQDKKEDHELLSEKLLSLTFIEEENV